MADPFDVLARPLRPMAPSPEFTAALRRRLEEELGMGTTVATGSLAMVHLRVDDADRAMRFYGALLDWDGERVVFDDHVSHYTTNTAITVRLLDDPSVPAVVPNYSVDDVDAVAASIVEAGGVVTSSEPGAWARGADDQGVPLLVYRRTDAYADRRSVRPVAGEPGLVFIRADSARARAFYGRVLGWPFERVYPDSHYFDTVERVGVFDEAAAFGRSAVAVTPSVTFYASVPALAPVLDRVVSLGGTAGPAAQDMGPFFTAMCTDDQGTEFGLMSERLDP